MYRHVTMAPHNATAVAVKSTSRIIGSDVAMALRPPSDRSI